VLSGLASVVAAQKVDAVLVAGDVYDRAVPSADATAVLDRVVERLLRAGAAVVMTPGNHDSARRLGTFSGLLSAAGLHVRAATSRLDEPVLLSDEHGDVAVYGLPFLEPEVARHELGLSGVMTTAAPALSSRSTTRSRTAVASADGTARSYTSPATSTASTFSAATTDASPLSTASCSASRSVPCSDRPMCQSEVCSSRMSRKVGRGYDRTG